MSRPAEPDRYARLLGLLGLGLRGGGVVVGVEGTRAMLKRGSGQVVVLASDASPRAREKVVPLARGCGVAVVVGPAAIEIGDRFGRPPVMVAGVEDRGIGRGVISLMAGRE